ncbi:hypothetical protein [Streptomyces sp. NPDC047981]|uniref:hypothetical protein n=1 Tax=Streptomyces sp. NPDC047981 TaxID=3154610 RepID=UPI003425FC35
MGRADRTAAFFRSLEGAEARLKTVRLARTRLRLGRRTRAVSAGVAVVCLILALTADGTGGIAVTLVPLLVAAGALGVMTDAWFRFVRPSLLVIAHEERAMLDEVNRLREMYAHIAIQEKWDPVVEKSVRQRLSRFPIQGGSSR